MKYVFSALSVIVLDQVSKYLVLRSSFQALTSNGSMAFDVSAKGLEAYLMLLVILILTTILALGKIEKRYYFGLSLIIGGGIGNLIDRLIHHSVIDFIHTGLIPTFNVADFSITAGTLIVLFWLFFFKKLRSEPNS